MKTEDETTWKLLTKICAELYKTYNADKIRNDACPSCGKTGHDVDADYCKYCGHQLDDTE